MAKRVKTEKEGRGKVTYRTTELFTERKEVFGKSPVGALKRMELRQADGYIRKTMFGVAIIWNGQMRHYADPRHKKSFRYFYIFALVKNDALRYIKTHRVKKIKELPPVHKNKELDTRGKRITAVDIDTAYWDIAFRLGIISEKTYDHGIMIPDKALAHAAISSLGKDDTWISIRRGKQTNNSVCIVGDDTLKQVYHLIRNTCFTLLHELAQLLGPDNYKERKTDAIYYIDNKRNNQIVHEFMKKHDFDIKPGIPLEPEKKRK